MRECWRDAHTEPNCVHLSRYPYYIIAAHKLDEFNTNVTYNIEGNEILPSTHQIPSTRILQNFYDDYIIAS